MSTQSGSSPSGGGAAQYSKKLRTTYGLAMARKKNPGEPRRTPVTVYLTSTEAKAFARVAQALGQPQSDLGRRALLLLLGDMLEDLEQDAKG